MSDQTKELLETAKQAAYEARREDTLRNWWLWFRQWHSARACRLGRHDDYKHKFLREVVLWDKVVSTTMPVGIERRYECQCRNCGRFRTYALKG